MRKIIMHNPGYGLQAGSLLPAKKRKDAKKKPVRRKVAARINPVAIEKVVIAKPKRSNAMKKRRTIKRRAAVVRRAPIVRSRRAVVARRRRSNPRFGKYRPTLLYTGKGWTAPKRGKLVKRGTRINPSFKGLLDRRMLKNAASIGAGVVLGKLAASKLRTMPALSPVMAPLGRFGGAVVSVVLGLVANKFAKKELGKQVALGIAVGGVVDAITASGVTAMIPGASTVSADASLATMSADTSLAGSSWGWDNTESWN